MDQDSQISQQILNKYKSLLDKQNQEMNSIPLPETLPDMEVKSGAKLSWSQNSDDLAIVPPKSTVRSVVHDSPKLAPYKESQNMEFDLFKQQMNQHYQKQIDTIAQDNTRLIENLKRNHREQIDQLEKERDIMLSQSRNTISALNQKLVTQEELLNQKQQHINTQLQDINAIKSLYDQKVADMANQNQSLLFANADLQNQVNSLSKQLEQLRNEFTQTTKQQYQLTQQNYSGQIQLYIQQNKQLQAKLNEQQTTNQQLIQSAVSDMRNLNNIIKQLQEKVEKLRTERETLKQKVLILSSENERIKDEGERNGGELEKLRERNSSLVRELLKCDKIIYGRK
ncbi:Conserved_hypothetical protein [Hexamita inflata]|uniref:Uncharacterized protein n=1 Tax=Hexamita inflata TaxID=28002 RepID=A0AA86US32_9EUKA|nr:Conserved hypothetical protein [Hexamita inflata]